MEDITPLDSIKTKIHTIRGKQVILDRDLAELYEVETKALNQAVKRNNERFPEDFCFQLTEIEKNKLVTICDHLKPLKYSYNLPYAFTEQGIANLSTVLKSKKAIHVNIQIMRTFVVMRKFLSRNAEIFQKIDTIEKRQIVFEAQTEERFEKVFKALETETPKQGIFYNGQVFDAYKFICDLIRTAKKRIILIDNYIDETVLELFTKTDVKVTIYTKNMLKLDFEKYKGQYKNIELKKFTLAHDRFIIIDGELYHIGASLKDIGKKWLGFSKFDEDSLKILDRLENPSKTANKRL
jgi:hypothetical protein